METATAISIAAFILSVIALWQTHFAKFKVVCAAGSLIFRIYPFQHKEKNWFIPSIDIPITITNVGARVGKIVGLRIRIKYNGLQTSSNFEFLTPEWEVDYKKYYPISNSRFEWIENAVLGGWTSFVVLPKQTINKHIVFETRWEEPVLHDSVTFGLEILTSTSRKWQEVAHWNAAISHGMLDEDIDSVSSFMMLESASEKIVRQQQINLSELHHHVNDEYFKKTGVSASQLISSRSNSKTKSRKKKR